MRSQNTSNLGAGLDIAFVAYLLNDLNLTIEASGSTFDQGYIGCKAHLVHMSSCGDVIQRIKHNVKGPEPRDVELGIHDVCMIGLELCVRPELLRNFLGNLNENFHISVFHIYHLWTAHIMRTRGAWGSSQGSGASAQGESV